MCVARGVHVLEQMTFNDATLQVFEPVSAEKEITGHTWVNCLIVTWRSLRRLKAHDANETPFAGIHTKTIHNTRTTMKASLFASRLAKAAVAVAPAIVAWSNRRKTWKSPYTFKINVRKGYWQMRLWEKVFQFEGLWSTYLQIQRCRSPKRT